jgi:ABC-type transport system substrate-binding protein
MVPQGCKEPDGTDFTDKSGLGQGKGYFDAYDEAIEANYAKAMGILRKYYDYDENTGMLTNFKPMTFLYSNGEDKESISVYLQGALEEIGITLNLETRRTTPSCQTGGRATTRSPGAPGSWTISIPSISSHSASRGPTTTPARWARAAMRTLPPTASTSPTRAST